MLRSSLKVNTPPVSVGAAATYEYNKDLARYLLMHTRYEEEYTLGKVVYEGDQKWLQVPRAICPISKDVDIRAEGQKVAIKCTAEARNDKQEYLLGNATPKILNHESFIIQAGTGVGKTVMAIKLMCDYGRTGLIVVDQENIMNQWYERLLEFTDLTPDDIGIIQADRCEVLGKKVCIAMIHSIAKEGRYPDYVYNYFGFCVWDEVHVVSADTFQNSCFLINSKVRLGLSATPERKDGKSEIIYAHIGPVGVVVDSVPLIPKVIIAQSPWKVPKVFNHQTKKMQTMQITPGRLMPAYKDMAKDKARMMVLGDFVHQAYAADRNIVCFSDLKDDILKPFKELLIHEFGISPLDIGTYVGGMKKAALEKASVKRVVLTTYKMTEKAVDCPWWDTAVFMTPRSDIRQTIGRVLREYEGKKNATEDGPGKPPIVFDLIDTDSSVLDNYFKSRLKYYRKLKAPVRGEAQLLNRYRIGSKNHDYRVVKKMG